MDLANTDVAVLCGGLGTRLRNVIGETQKTMATVAGEPFLNLVLEYLKNHGFSRVILCTGYQAEQVEEYYKNRDVGLKLEFSREHEPLGTGGAIKNARGKIHSENFIVLNGDSFCPVQYPAFLNYHQQKKAIVTIAVSQVADSRDYGTVLLDEQNHITGFKEKSASAWSQAVPGYVNAGVYCFNHTALSLMPPQVVFSLEKDVFPTLPQRIGKDFYGFPVEGEFMDIGTNVRFQAAQGIFHKEK